MQSGRSVERRLLATARKPFCKIQYYDQSTGYDQILKKYYVHRVVLFLIVNPCKLAPRRIATNAYFSVISYLN
jgi:hypothetical protein